MCWAFGRIRQRQSRNIIKCRTKNHQARLIILVSIGPVLWFETKQIKFIYRHEP